jgi:hypothetical protein
VVKEVGVEVEAPQQTYLEEMVETEEFPVEAEVAVVREHQQEQVEMGVQVVEVRCGFILGNKIFIKIKLCQII